jgi:predicted aminopeptidase
MRGLERVQQSIDLLGGKVVTQDTYQADRRALDAQIKDMRDEIDAFHTKSRERDNAEAAQRADADRMRKTATLSIALAIAGPIITAIVGILLARGGAP